MAESPSDRETEITRGKLDAHDGTASARPGPAPPPAVVGRIIGGNFRVLKLIGTGAMGHVYQAEQLSLGKMVALKLLRQELAGDEKLIKRFELEAKNASSLNHPNSIQIIEFGRDGDLLFIAMELLPGVDLGQLILREGPLPLPRLGRIMDQVLAALDEAHAHGIVHRDLKPGNIMLVSRRDDPDFVKVCDFGIAKAQTSEAAGLTLKGLVCGTPEYMSPEQARGEDVDGRSDLYSVGVILYQLVTGELPFSASSPVGILSKHLAEPPMPPSLRRPGLSIPPALEGVILHALAKETSMRPRSADHLRRALRAALADLPAGATFGFGPRTATTYDALGAQPTTPLGLPARHRPPSQPGTDAGRSSGGSSEGSLASFRGDAPGTVPTRPRTRRRLAIGGVFVGLLGFGVWLLLARPMIMPGSQPGVGAPPSTALTVSTPAAPRVAASPALAAPALAAPALAAPALVAPSEPQVASPAVAPSNGARDRSSRARDKRAASARARHDEAPAVAGLTGADHPARFETSHAPARAGDPMKEAERLLAQGDVAGACAKGEEQRQATPESAPVYKFLGKCYMRIGKPEPAMVHYRRYLELAPDASDAAFIRSIVR